MPFLEDPPMPKKCPVRLEVIQRERLAALLASRVGATRTLIHARILRKADKATYGPNWKTPPLPTPASSSNTFSPQLQVTDQQLNESGMKCATSVRSKPYVHPLKPSFPL